LSNWCLLQQQQKMKKKKKKKKKKNKNKNKKNKKKKTKHYEENGGENVNHAKFGDAMRDHNVALGG